MDGIIFKIFLFMNTLAAIYLSCFTFKKEFFKSIGKVMGTFIVVINFLGLLTIAADIFRGKAVGEFAVTGLIAFIMSILFACASNKEGRMD